VAEQAGGLLQRVQHQLRHAVVKAVRDRLGFGVAELAFYIKGNAAFQALDFGQAAVTGDIGGLAGPWRDRAETRKDQKQAAAWLLNRHARAVFQETGEDLLFFVGQSTGDFSEVGEFSVQATNSWNFSVQLLQ
jgi:hypothetical protein